MEMKKAILGLTLSITAAFSSVAMADIVCEVQSKFGPAKIQVGKQTITVTGGALKKPQVFQRYESDYDGHMTALITAKGFALSFENWYGCIHNARITTDFRGREHVGSIESVEVSQCRGGSSSDEICRVF
jgi:hypothetical protein